MIYQKHLFTPEECSTIISYAQEDPNIKDYFIFSETTTAKIENHKLTIGLKTSYNVYMIFNTEQTSWMFERITDWFEQESGVKMNRGSKVTHCTLHRYEKGDCFTKHVDITEGFESRRYNLGIQLNEEYKGGDYLIWDDNNKETVFSKKAGTALAYHGRLFHEITEITEGERWSIVMPIGTYNIIEKKALL